MKKIIITLSIILASTVASCDTPTVSCWEDPGIDGWACKCTLGPTPPSCTDLGSCLVECPLQ